MSESKTHKIKLKKSTKSESIQYEGGGKVFNIHKSEPKINYFITTDPRLDDGIKIPNTFKAESTSSIRGDKGETGPKGDKGETGPKGDKGETGPKGERGDIGPKGDRGERGETGPKGDKGETGAKGERGEPGPKGDKGDIGPKGDKGDRGEKGDTGAKGEPGSKGDKGDRGERGEPGPKGDKGETGAKGERGEPGPKGDRGERGEPGTSVESTGFLIPSGTLVISPNSASFEEMEARAQPGDLVIVYPGKYEISGLTKNYINWFLFPGVKLSKLGSGPLITVTEGIKIYGYGSVDTGGNSIFSINPNMSPNIDITLDNIINTNICDNPGIIFDIRGGGHINIMFSKAETGKQQLLFLQGNGIVNPKLRLEAKRISVGGKIDAISLYNDSSSVIICDDINSYIGNGINIIGGDHILNCKELNCKVSLRGGHTNFTFNILRATLELTGGTHYIKGFEQVSHSCVTLSGNPHGSLNVSRIKAVNVAVNCLMNGGSFRVKVCNMIANIGLLIEPTKYDSEIAELKFIVENADVFLLSKISGGSKLSLETRVQKAIAKNLYEIGDIHEDSSLVLFTRGTSSGTCFDIVASNGDIKISGTYKSDSNVINTERNLIIYNCFILGKIFSPIPVTISSFNSIIEESDQKVKII